MATEVRRPGTDEEQDDLLRNVKESELKPVHTWPHLVSIELIGALIFTLLLSIMAIFVRAPFYRMADPELTPNPAKAPWYFLGLQELLLHMHPALAGVVVPTALLILLGAIPYIDKSKKGTGIWFYSKKGVPIAVFSAIYTTVWNLSLILLDEYLPAGGSTGIAPFLKMHGFPDAFGEIFVPLVFMTFIPFSLWVIVKRRWNADTRELMIAMYSFFLASFIVLTIVGTAFRGEGMALTWPWEIPHPPIGKE
ncbi:MAG: menaquinol-cytochrome C reductase [Bacillota bacterium]|nr:MAG: menaquinol-cytochrome C reductase [Bacillota bacterium]